MKALSLLSVLLILTSFSIERALASPLDSLRDFAMRANQAGRKKEADQNNQNDKANLAMHVSNDLATEIDKFAVVSKELLRGAQPADERGFELLKRAGVDTIVSLRTEDILVEKERRLVEGLGMRFVHIPLYVFEEPRPRDFERFLALFGRSENVPVKVFVHCRQGQDRTGVMVGAYRVAREGWSPDKAYDEMRRFGFRPAFANLQSGFFSYARK